MSARTGGLTVSPAMRQQLLLLGTSVTQPKGSILFRHGDPVRGAFLVCTGKLLLAVEGGDALFPPRILGPGSVAGLPASVAGSPYSLTAEVVADAELSFVPRQALLDCLEQNPTLCFEVMDILSAEISVARSIFKKPPPRSRKS